MKFQGSGEDDIWISLIEELDGQSPVELKKSGEKRARKEQRENTRNNRKLKRKRLTKKHYLENSLVQNFLVIPMVVSVWL